MRIKAALSTDTQNVLRMAAVQLASRMFGSRMLCLRGYGRIHQDLNAARVGNCSKHALW